MFFIKSRLDYIIIRPRGGVSTRLMGACLISAGEADPAREVKAGRFGLRLRCARFGVLFRADAPTL
jgi:hypothetical protein